MLLYFSVKRLKTVLNIPTAGFFFTLAVGIFLLSPMAYAEPSSLDIEIRQCENFLISKDIEKRYELIQKKLEEDFSQGAPNELKNNLVRVRNEIDSLSLRYFDVDKSNHQEVNLLVQQILVQVEKMIQLLPQASNLVPQIRSQYVVPFTNINSIKAEHQDCMMKVAVANAKKELANENQEASNDDNVYEKLTAELNQLNRNLYLLETTDVQKYIGLRAELLASLELYNKEKFLTPQLTGKIPTILNSVQIEIEKMLPGLQLSKKYYSIVNY